MPLQLVDGRPTNVPDLPFDADTLSFKFQLRDQFVKTDAINTTLTNATRSGACYILSYDTENITVVGNNITIASTPDFTVAVGDVVVNNGFCARILSVTSQTQVSVDDGSGLITGSATISQAVHTEDINSFGSAADKSRPIDTDASAISSTLLNYIDDTAAATGTAPNVGSCVSSNNFSTQTVFTNPESRDTQTNSITLTSPGTSLSIRFYSNLSGSGTVKLLGYKISWL